MLEFPLYSINQRSLRHSLLTVTTGGRLEIDSRNRMMVRALDQVSFTIRRGERVGLIGHNGAGKSILLRTIAGIYAPTNGLMVHDGTVNTLFDLSLGIDNDASGLQNIYYRGYLLGLKRHEIDRLVPAIADFADIGLFLDVPMHTYSSGMSLRLAFAISTAIDRDILLMDEWMAAGDANFQKKAEARLHELAGRSGIVVLASHSEDIIRRLCGRVLLLHHGRLVGDGSPAEMFARYKALNEAPAGNEPPRPAVATRSA